MELHSFPGFDDATPTPLPSPLTPTDILQVVTSAQLDLERKVMLSFSTSMNHSYSNLGSLSSISAFSCSFISASVIFA